MHVVYLVGEMNGQIVRHGVVIGAGQADITLGKKQHVGCSAGNEEVRPDIELLPFQEQRLVDVPVRALQDMSPTGSRNAQQFKPHPKPHCQFILHRRTKMFVRPCFNIP